MRPRNRDPLPGNRLIKAILSLQPTTLHVLDSLGSVRDLCSGDWTATYTGSPTLAQARAPINTGVTFSGTGQYATTSGSVPPPTASMSVLAVATSGEAAGTARYVVGRGAASQHTWRMSKSSGGALTFQSMQSGGTAHASATVSGDWNDGQPHLVMGTFDGTTIRTRRDAVAEVTSTSLTGSWHTASTAGIGIGVWSATSPFLGTIHLVAYWADRVITDAERLWLYSIMAGG